MSSNVFEGTIPALMTPCRPDRTPDFDALVRRAEALIGAKVVVPLTFCRSSSVIGVLQLGVVSFSGLVDTALTSSPSALTQIIPRASPWSTSCGLKELLKLELLPSLICTGALQAAVLLLAGSQLLIQSAGVVPVLR